MSRSTKIQYGNYEVFHPKGHLMFRCDLKKINWYLDRNLAIRMSDNAIKLTFEPKGNGEEDFFLKDSRKNHCVVSGSTIDLTKHHVVPSQFRTYFPLKYKSRNSNDVVVLNRDIHDEYELIANEYKTYLKNYYIAESEIEYNDELFILKSRMARNFNALKDHSDRMPVERKKELLEEKAINDEEYAKSGKYFLNFDEMIVERMGVENMIISWRKHFTDTMNPKYLPDWWNINYIKIVDG